MASGSGNPERDSVLEPRVARHELPWVNRAKFPNQLVLHRAEELMRQLRVGV